MTRFARAAFLAAAAAPAQFPPEGPPEIAFLGRSNVGKSSAINALTGRRRLAFASKTPGRTQTVNFYDLGGEARLIDLPGYGYARVPRSERTAWERLVRSYLFGRATLAGLVLLMDARHPFTALDRQLLAWLEPLAVPRLLVLTKADKLSRTERGRAPGSVQKTLYFSSTTREGVQALRARLEQWLREGLSRSRV
jgi:GTP-binding protein